MDACRGGGSKELLSIHGTVDGVNKSLFDLSTNVGGDLDLYNRWDIVGQKLRLHTVNVAYYEDSGRYLTNKESFKSGKIPEDYGQLYRYDKNGTTVLRAESRSYWVTRYIFDHYWILSNGTQISGNDIYQALGGYSQVANTSNWLKATQPILPHAYRVLSYESDWLDKSGETWVMNPPTNYKVDTWQTAIGSIHGNGLVTIKPWEYKGSLWSGTKLGNAFVTNKGPTIWKYYTTWFGGFIYGTDVQLIIDATSDWYRYVSHPTYLNKHGASDKIVFEVTFDTIGETMTSAGYVSSFKGKRIPLTIDTSVFDIPTITVEE